METNKESVARLAEMARNLVPKFWDNFHGETATLLKGGMPVDEVQARNKSGGIVEGWLTVLIGLYPVLLETCTEETITVELRKMLKSYDPEEKEEDDQCSTSS